MYIAFTYVLMYVGFNVTVYALLCNVFLHTNIHFLCFILASILYLCLTVTVVGQATCLCNVCHSYSVCYAYVRTFVSSYVHMHTHPPLFTLSLI